MASRSLTGGSPRRLWQERGQWVLEIVRHVNIGHDLVRPTTECLSGNRLISSYFKSNPDQEQLGRRALKLLQSQGGEGRCYTAVGSEWVGSSLPPNRPAAPGGVLERGAALEEQLTTLRQRVKELVTRQEQLLRRLARLEAQALQLGEVDELDEPDEPAALGGLDDLAGRGHTREQEGGAEPALAALPRVAEVAHVAAAPHREAGPASNRAAPAAAPRLSQAAAGPAAVALDARARPLAALELPPVAELCHCIALLVGGGVAVQEGEPQDMVALAAGFAAGIETESGELVGLIVMDLRATVFLGGSLMMQPAEQLQQQFASAAPEPDSIAASAEICSALCAAVNAAQSRYHVRATELGQLDPGGHDWLDAVVTRRDLKDSLGGCTTVLARPGA